MITAKQAREILAKSQKGQKQQLEMISNKIIEKAKSGDPQQIIQHDVPSPEWVMPIIESLTALGFKASQIHNSGIDVRW